LFPTSNLDFARFFLHSSKSQHFCKGWKNSPLNKELKIVDKHNAANKSINSNLAQEKVCECFNVDFFQAMRLVYGYVLKQIIHTQLFKHPQGHFRPF
jgi:hypothetical protein